jgi:hypothetical protein
MTLTAYSTPICADSPTVAPGPVNGPSNPILRLSAAATDVAIAPASNAAPKAIALANARFAD